MGMIWRHGRWFGKDVVSGEGEPAREPPVAQAPAPAAGLESKPALAAPSATRIHKGPASKPSKIAEERQRILDGHEVVNARLEAELDREGDEAPAVTSARVIVRAVQALTNKGTTR